MGLASAPPSDAPSYIMVEPSGCRCACQDDVPDQTPCCSPHVFTSILLGILSCVLMTGGVFLAFHKWDPMWLLVSGIGVVLIVVGTVLHCCHALAVRRSTRRASGAPGKGCCPRAAPADHPGGQLVMSNGSLTEQLLPLSNARSVSQLSLNMLPGYFPPVMTAYGIEQHSAVVQNISRLVQQQQAPQANGSGSPGVASNAGKSFLVLSLPSDTSAANIQNLVATVYQLDGSAAEPNIDAPNASSPITIIKPNPVPSVLKNAEVQTCNAWPAVSAAAIGVASTSTANSVLQTHPSTANCTLQPHTVSTSTGETQTDDVPQTPTVLNLMDCPVEAVSVTDPMPSAVSDTQTPDRNHNTSALNTNSTPTSPEPSPSVPSTPTIVDSTPIIVELPGHPPSPIEPVPSTSILVDVNDAPSTSILVDVNDVPSTSILVDVTDVPSTSSYDIPSNSIYDVPSNCRNDVLVDVSGHSVVDGSTSQCPIVEDLVNTVIHQVDVDDTNLGGSSIPNDVTLIELTTDAAGSNLAGTSDGPLLASQSSNVSINDADDVDEGELMDRSSPPPSYDDVTLEGEAVGAFGLAYGTI